MGKIDMVVIRGVVYLDRINVNLNHKERIRRGFIVASRQRGLIQIHTGRRTWRNLKN